MKLNDIKDSDIKKLFSEAEIKESVDIKKPFYVKSNNGKSSTMFLVEENAKQFLTKTLREEVKHSWIEHGNKIIFLEGYMWKEEVKSETSKKIVNIETNENNESLFNDEKTKLFDEFLDYTKQFLNIKELPIVNILYNKKEGMTAGAYSPQEKELWVLGKNRAFADILRSVAHELVHHQQKENGELEKYELRDVGGKIEDDANSIAGQIIKSFGKIPKYKNIYEL